MRECPGRKGFDLNYEEISKLYLGGESLKNLADLYDVSQWTLLDNFKKLGIRKTTKRKINKKAFNNFNSMSCYWAGFIAADGSVSNYQLSVELASIDENHLEKLCKFLNSNAKISNRVRNNYRCSCVFFNSVDLVDILKNNYNIIKNKSLVLEPPNNIPNCFIKDYIRGYIDGDGSIGWHKNNNKPRLNICSGSKNFLEWIKKEIKSISETIGNPSVCKRKNSKVYVIEFMGQQVHIILNWLYKDADVYLDRKYNKYMNICHGV